MHIQTSDQKEVVMGFGDYSCNWGLHICGLYESEQERDEIIFGFFAQGIKDHDLNAYCPCERTQEDFSQKFASIHAEYACHCADPDYMIFPSARSLYYPEGVFSPYKMDENLNKVYSESQKNGPRNIRSSAEMVWALDAIPGVKHLMAYESRLNYFLPDKPWVSICLYNLNLFDGRTIMGVLQTHPFTINKGVITRNPYFRDPDTWLRENAPEFLPPGR